MFFQELLDGCDTVEISPETGVIVENITERIIEDGGFALFADYGHSGEKGLTFRVRFCMQCVCVCVSVCVLFIWLIYDNQSPM